MSETASIQEVHLWFRSRFSDYRRRGLIPQREVDAFNRAHPERPYVGPVLNTRHVETAAHMARQRQKPYRPPEDAA